MTVRKLDENGDIVTSGKQFTSETDEIAQTIKTRLKLYLGEYFRDVTDGTPWWESILGKDGTLSSKEAFIKNRIIRTEGVISILEFTTDFDSATREYSIAAAVQTTSGTTTITVST